MFDPKSFLQNSFSKDDLFKTLERLGVKQADTLLVHSSLFALGLPSDNIVNLDEFYYKALREYVGEQGTLIFPAFTYSYCKGQSFDIKNTQSAVSSLANYCIHKHIGYRSADALFSYIIDGLDAPNLKFSNVCFDIEDGIAGYMLDKNARVLMLGVGFAWLTAFYSVDQKLKVPYRFFKEFKGTTVYDTHECESSFYYFCRALCDNTVNNNDTIDTTLAQHGDKTMTVTLGRGSVSSALLSDLFFIFESYVKQDPWYFLQGPATDTGDLKDAAINKMLYPCYKL